MKKKIAIIGSGIAGLTIANLFKANSNFKIIVYEKEKILSLEEGYGIQLAPNSISILNKIFQFFIFCLFIFSLMIGRLQFFRKPKSFLFVKPICLLLFI